MKIALAGDVMLGRTVDEEVIRNRALPPSTVWGNVLPLMLGADARVANLECVISGRGQPWKPREKAFHFRAHPRAVDVLRAARIDVVSLANNHVLDYGADALGECLALLDRGGIRHAGAGAGLRDAMAPASLETPAGRFVLVALTDNEPEWEATERRPGINYVDYNGNGMVEPYRSRIAAAITGARASADFVIVGAHVGPNWGAPSAAMQALARELLDLGADLYWGHSNHTPQGIERYRGKAILYSAGDFIDDYAVDPAERNDLSFLFMLEVDRDRTARLRLHPVAIEDCRVRRANGAEAAFLQDRMQAKCAAFGTRVTFRDGVGAVEM